MRRDPAVDEYLAAVPPARLAILEPLVAACREELEGFTEEIRYSMPGYSRNGTVEIGVANQRRYVSFYVLRTAVLDAHRGALAGLSMGKGCVRLTRPGQIADDTVREMLRATAAGSGTVC